MAEINNKGLVLTDAQKLSLGLSTVSDVLSIFPTYAQGKMQANAYTMQAAMNNKNAEQLTLDASEILRSGMDSVNAIQEQGYKVKGEQISAMGGSGFDIKSGSFEKILNETDYNIARNVEAVKYNTQVKYGVKQTEAEMQRVQADLNKASAKITKKNAQTTAFTSALSGAAKLGFMGAYS